MPYGARIVQLPDNFKIEINIRNGVVHIFFIDNKNDKVVFGTGFFIDQKGFRCFEKYREEGRKLILERLKDSIVSDICTFISGNYEGENIPGVRYHSIKGCLDIESYREDWFVYYRLICLEKDILEHYTDPEE